MISWLYTDVVAGEAAGLLFPFRKPKRIRTAFSPSQLIQLEDAFNRNHYVVGQERKDLAADLNLTETQVYQIQTSLCRIHMYWQNRCIIIRVYSRSGFYI